VLAWEPPERLLLLGWAPTPERPAVTEVEVRFTAVAPDHTRVELEHRGWDRLGDQAARVRAGYRDGWPGVLDAFAGTAMAAQHRWFARSLNGLVWRLLARTDRTAADDARMVDAAHASQHHWREAGGPPATGASGWSPGSASAPARPWPPPGRRRRRSRRGRRPPG
jgi:Activator of Hsp90 ATPase homolog 1-like protein